MSIQTIREVLKAAGAKDAATATMRYGERGVQIYVVGGREIERPAGEMVGVSAVEIARALKETP